jgi:hypothetical protein
MVPVVFFGQQVSFEKTSTAIQANSATSNQRGVDLISRCAVIRQALKRTSTRASSRESQFRHKNVTCVSLNFSALERYEKTFHAPGASRGTKKVGVCFARW